MGAEQVYCVYEGNTIKSVSLTYEDAAESLKELEKVLGGSFYILTRHLNDPVETQYERYQLAQKSLENGNGTGYGDLLDKAPRVFAGRAEQEALDYFDYDKAVRVAREQGWTYRDEPITVRMLIKDAIEVCQVLGRPGCSSYQLGRLKGYKIPIYDENDKPTQGYEIHLLFFVESVEGESLDESEDC